MYVFQIIDLIWDLLNSTSWFINICGLFGGHFGFWQPSWMLVRTLEFGLVFKYFILMHLGAIFKKSYLFQASYTEYSAISMIYGGHFEFWRPSWILKRC